jgi:predicted dehydrogenase
MPLARCLWAILSVRAKQTLGSGGMNHPRVGIIGSGFMAAVHAAAWGATQAEFSALLTRSDRSVVGDLDMFLADRYTDLRGFLKAIDIVDICAPTHLHAEFARAAAAAGKPTICEKPLVLSSVEGKALIDVFEAADIPLFVAHVLRFGAPYSTLRAAVTAGCVGVPAVLRLSRLSFAPKRNAGSWFADPAKSGGIEFDLMIHDLDYARWVAGDVVSVYSKSARSGHGHAIIILTHESGAVSHIEGSWANPAPVFRELAEITGSDGVIGFCSDDTSALTVRLHRGDADSTTGLGDIALAANPFEVELRHFLDVLDGTAELLVTSEDALEAVRLAEAARESSRTGLPVQLERPKSI